MLDKMVEGCFLLRAFAAHETVFALKLGRYLVSIVLGRAYIGNTIISCKRENVWKLLTTSRN